MGRQPPHTDQPDKWLRKYLEYGAWFNSFRWFPVQEFRTLSWSSSNVPYNN
jgi:hypothetical protein